MKMRNDIVTEIANAEDSRVRVRVTKTDLFDYDYQKWVWSVSVTYFDEPHLSFWEDKPTKARALTFFNTWKTLTAS